VSVTAKCSVELAAPCTLEPFAAGDIDLGTVRARDALVELYHQCFESNWVNPNYKAIVLRSYVAGISSSEELFENLRSHRFLNYTLMALRDSGDAAASVMVVEILPKIHKKRTLRQALKCLTVIAARERSPSAAESLEAGCLTICDHPKADFATRLKATKILNEDFGHHLPPPRRQLGDYGNLIQRYLPLIAALAVLIVIGVAFFFGPPHPSSVENSFGVWGFLLQLMFTVSVLLCFWLLSVVGKKVIDWRLRHRLGDQGVSELSKESLQE